jgi:UDP-N-acetyl-D-glucosamine dehydrogenase
VESIALADRDLYSVELDDQTLSEQDCVVILTAHPHIDLARVVRASKLVFDTRGATRDIHATNIVRL